MFAFVSAPIDTPPPLGSLADNLICGITRFGDGTYTAEGITKLCEGLKGSELTWLECAAAPECSLSCQRPLTRTCSLTAPAQPPGSLFRNSIGPEGASALAAVLKETQITNLKCAATR